MWLAACGGGGGAPALAPPAQVTSPTPSTDTGSTGTWDTGPFAPLTEPGLIQSVGVEIDAFGETGTVDLARKWVDEVCWVTATSSECGPPWFADYGGCAEGSWASGQGVRVEAWDDGALADCVVRGVVPGGHPDCRSETFGPTPPACVDFEAPLIVTCGPTVTTVRVVYSYIRGGELRIATDDGTVDELLRISDGFECAQACGILPSCPPDGLTWTATDPETGHCAIVGPDLDGTAPCDIGTLTLVQDLSDPDCDLCGY